MKLAALILFATALAAQVPAAGGPCTFQGAKAFGPHGEVFACVDDNIWQEVAPGTATPADAAPQKYPLIYWRGFLVGLFAGQVIGAAGMAVAAAFKRADQTRGQANG